MNKNINAYAILKGAEVRGVARFIGIGGGSMVEIYAEGFGDMPADGGYPALAVGGETCADGQTLPGRFPVLFAADGRAHMNFYTDRFYPGDIIGKTLRLHGESGIAAVGEIRLMSRRGQR